MSTPLFLVLVTSILFFLNSQIRSLPLFSVAQSFDFNDFFPLLFFSSLFHRSSALLIYSWLCWVFAAAHPVTVSGAYSLWGTGFSLQWLPLLQSASPRELRPQQLHLPGSSEQAQQLWHTGPAALWHVGFSRTRDQTCVSCIGRQILYHQTAREALDLFLLLSFFHLSLIFFFQFLKVEPEIINFRPLIFKYSL